MSITTAYDIFARASMATYFFYFVVALSAAGMVLVALRTRQAPTASWWTLNGYETVMAGSAVALTLLPSTGEAAGSPLASSFSTDPPGTINCFM